MNNFSPLTALAGGALIGLASALLLAIHGRVAGISGILTGVISPRTTDRGWRWAFLIGLVGGGALLSLLVPGAFGAAMLDGLPLVGAGAIVGLGARISGGCTSGHGVCGLGRFSKRSLVAVMTFMGVAVGTVALVRVLA